MELPAVREVPKVNETPVDVPAAAGPAMSGAGPMLGSAMADPTAPEPRSHRPTEPGALILRPFRSAAKRPRSTSMRSGGRR